MLNLKKLNNKIYYILFVTSVIIIILLIIFLFSYFTKLRQKEISSKNFSSTLQILKLYSEHSNYKIQTYSSPFVIGIIKIDKLKLDYPILSEVSDELLKIAPCKFAGPNPNEIGNFCIAGHNYIDNTFFAKISTLKTNDSIYIYDLSGNSVEYLVYKQYEVESTDTSILSQETNGKRKLTLMTCNSLKGSRIIIEAFEA